MLKNLTQFFHQVQNLSGRCLEAVRFKDSSQRINQELPPWRQDGQQAIRIRLPDRSAKSKNPLQVIAASCGHVCLGITILLCISAIILLLSLNGIEPHSRGWINYPLLFIGLGLSFAIPLTTFFYLRVYQWHFGSWHDEIVLTPISIIAYTVSPVGTIRRCLPFHNCTRISVTPESLNDQVAKMEGSSCLSRLECSCPYSGINLHLADGYDHQTRKALSSLLLRYLKMRSELDPNLSCPELAHAKTLRFTIEPNSIEHGAVEISQSHDQTIIRKWDGIENVENSSLGGITAYFVGSILFHIAMVSLGVFWLCSGSQPALQAIFFGICATVVSLGLTIGGYYFAGSSKRPRGISKLRSNLEITTTQISMKHRRKSLQFAANCLSPIRGNGSDLQFELTSHPGKFVRFNYLDTTFVNAARQMLMQRLNLPDERVSDYSKEIESLLRRGDIEGTGSETEIQVLQRRRQTRILVPTRSCKNYILPGIGLSAVVLVTSLISLSPFAEADTSDVGTLIGYFLPLLLLLSGLALFVCDRQSFQISASDSGIIVRSTTYFGTTTSRFHGQCRATCPRGRRGIEISGNGQVLMRILESRSRRVQLLAMYAINRAVKG